MGNFFEDKFHSNRLVNSDYMRWLLQPYYPGGELICAKSEDIQAFSIDYFIKKGVRIVAAAAIKKRYHDYGDLLIETKSCAETGSPSWVDKAKLLPSKSLFYICYDFSKEEAKNPGNCVDEILATDKEPSTFIRFDFEMFVETWEEYKDYWITCCDTLHLKGDSGLYTSECYAVSKVKFVAVYCCKMARATEGQREIKEEIDWRMKKGKKSTYRQQLEERRRRNGGKLL
jgi:hypothetical protein